MRLYVLNYFVLLSLSWAAWIPLFVILLAQAVGHSLCFPKVGLRIPIGNILSLIELGTHVVQLYACLLFPLAPVDNYYHLSFVNVA